MADENGNLPRVYLARLFERTDRRGQRFFVGRLGDATLYAYPGASPDRGDPTLEIWLRQRHEASPPNDGPDGEVTASNENGGENGKTT